MCEHLSLGGGGLSPERRHRNLTGYVGEMIEVQSLFDDVLAQARQFGWQVEELCWSGGHPIAALSRERGCSTTDGRSIYLSAGIHGDEPASPVAALELIKADDWPADCRLYFCPCLNPWGLSENRRENPDGIDLNRDYRDPKTPEARAHLAWLERLPRLDLALFLHEDWEADGFYLYELARRGQASLAEKVLRRVGEVCPISRSDTLDGWDAVNGIVRPNVDPELRPEWPEAVYAFQRKTDLTYTFEAPSDYDLPTRVAALTAAVRAALEPGD